MRLQLDKKCWPTSLDTSCQELSKGKLKVKPVQILQLEVFNSIMRIGNFNRSKKVISWCLRCRSKIRGQYVTTDDLNQATIVRIKIAQKELFNKEIIELETRKDINRNLRLGHPLILKVSLE